jgi:hypothetical protein
MDTLVTAAWRLPISPDHVSHDTVGMVDADTPVRVQRWDGRPLWGWRPA